MPDTARVFVDRFGHLHGELARRHEHEAARPFRPAGGLRQAMEHRQREGSRLSGPCGRLPEHVAPRDEQRNRLPLHGRRFFVAETGDGRDELLAKPERHEGGGC